MKTKEKILKWSIYVTGIVCLAIFIIVRNEHWYYKLTKSGVPYGDLYELCNIDDFKSYREPIIAGSDSSYTSELNKNNQILLFGDSFSYTANKAFTRILADSLYEKIYISLSQYPLFSLRQLKGDTTCKRILVFEMAERSILWMFSNKHLTSGPIIKRNELSNLKLVQILKAFKDAIAPAFPDDIAKKYAYFFDRGIVTASISRKLNTFRFQKFGYISRLTPKYNIDPPMLFYYQTVNNQPTSFYYPITNLQIQTICNNIDSLHKDLKALYNTELIFMPIPNKYTIYHHYINDDNYNNLLPLLYKELANRNIPFIDLYTPFTNSQKILYYPSDSHWNKEGMMIATYLLKQKILEFRQKSVKLDCKN